MRKALDIFIDDFRQLKGNIIAIVIICGLILLPSLYAWFSLLAFWNPEDNTGDVSVAVANEDAGYQSDLIPTRIDAGAQIVNELRAEPKFNWVFVDSDTAIDGVKSGKYYAAIVIPEDFSANMVSVFSHSLENPSIGYYVNEKINPIAPHITSIGASTIQEDIDQTFTSTVTDIALGTNSNLAQFMEGKGLEGYAGTLVTNLNEASDELKGDASQVRAFSAMIEQTKLLVDTSSETLKETGEITENLEPLVQSTREGLDNTMSSTDELIDLAAGALGTARGSLERIETSTNQAFDTLRKDPAAIQGVVESLQTDLAAVKKVYASALREIRDIDPSSPLVPAIQGVITHIDGLSSTLGEVSSDIRNGTANLDEERQKVETSLNGAMNALDGIQSKYGDAVQKQASELKANLDKLGDDTVTISSELKSAMDTLANSTGPLVKSMDDICSSLDETARMLEQSAESLVQSRDDLSRALAKNDMTEVQRIIGNNPEGLAKTLAAPASIEKHAVYGVANFGSAISPFYTSLALFIAVIFIMVVLKVELTPERRKRLGDPGTTEEYIGHGAFLFLITIAQALLICTGNVFYLGVQCDSIPLYYLTGLVSAFVFFNIIYSLVVAFGNVGRALAVVLLVMQVAGSGGELPIQLSAQIFQDIYPWLPFTHSMNMFQGAIAGVYGNQYLISLLCLLAFVIPACIVGMVLRKPIMKLNDYVNAQLEKTGVM